MLRMRELRKARKMTMKQLGVILGLSESAISLYETGKNEPDIKTLQKTAEFFGVSLDYLLGNDTGSEQPDENDQQKKPPISGELDAALVDLLTGLSPSETQRVRDFVAGLVARKEAPPSAKS